MHNNKKLTLSAPLSGPVIKLALVPDEVFSSGVMGDGIAIDPLNDCLYAPCDGVIVHVAKTAHALTLRADNGAEVLLHVGLDTFDLQGEGFQLLIENGAQVSNGQPLLRFDPDYIAQRCTSLISLLVLTNGDLFELQLLEQDTAEAGAPLLQVAARQVEAVVTATGDPGQQARGSVRITHHGGLHARPAALIRQTALGFKSSCRLHIGANSAPCQSIVRLLWASARTMKFTSAVTAKMPTPRCRPLWRRWAKHTSDPPLPRCKPHRRRFVPRINRVS